MKVSSNIELEEFLSGTGTSTQRPEQTTALMRDWQEAEVALLRSVIKPNNIVLETGCGIGRVIELVDDGQIQIIGIDFVRGIVERTAKRFKGNKRVTIIHANACSLPFDEGTFDVTVCAYNTLGNIEPPSDFKAVNEMIRVTKKGGKVVASVYSENALSAQLECYAKAGWNVIYYDHEIVRLDNGWSSRRFSLQSLLQLFRSNMVGVSIQPLCTIAWGIVVTKII